MSFIYWRIHFTGFGHIYTLDTTAPRLIKSVTFDTDIFYHLAIAPLQRNPIHASFLCLSNVMSTISDLCAIVHLKRVIPGDVDWKKESYELQLQAPKHNNRVNRLI